MNRITRRQMLRGSGAVALGAAAAGVLAACGSKPSTKPSGGGHTLPPKAGKLSFANWPLYIDVTDDGKRPSLEQFQKESGIVVDYKEAIEDNDPFFGTIREPLARGRSTGWDLIVVTDWLAGRMVRLGYAEPLHYDLLPNVTANLGSAFREPPGDPGGKHSVPWQAGVVGIGYNPKLTGREITSLGDLFDPAFKGKVGMFSDMRDMIHLGLLWKGIEPSNASDADVRAVVKALVKQRTDGIVRDYFENDYTDALAKGDLALTLAYSGDVFQLQADNPDLRFVVPKEGGILFVDAMVIPKGAEHAADAHEMIDFVYRPEIAAQIAESVQYITPVPAAKPIIERHAADASGEEKEELSAIAASPLVFLSPDVESRLRRYRILSEDEEKEWNDLFAQVVEA